MGIRQVTLRAVEPQRPKGPAGASAMTRTEPAARTEPSPAMSPMAISSPHLELRIFQRTRTQLAGRELLREELLVERCLPDGRLLSLETERRAPGGTLTRRRLRLEGNALKIAEVSATDSPLSSAPDRPRQVAHSPTSTLESSPTPRSKEALTLSPPAGASVMGHCALWIAFATQGAQSAQGTQGAQSAQDPRSALGDPTPATDPSSASQAPPPPASPPLLDPAPRRLVTVDAITGALRPGLLLRLPPLEDPGPGDLLVAPGGARLGVAQGFNPRLSSRPAAVPPQLRFRFADAEHPRLHTDYLLGPSGVPELVHVRGVEVPLTLSLSTRAHAEAALAGQARSQDESHLTLDVGARLPEPTTLLALRYAVRLAEPLPPEAARALDEGQQRRLPGGAPDGTLGGTAETFTIEVRRADVTQPAVAALPYPLPLAQIPEALRGYLHPRLPPALPPGDPARRTLAAELSEGTEITTALGAALRLTRWAARPDVPATQGAARASARDGTVARAGAAPLSDSAARADSEPRADAGPRADADPRTDSADLSYPPPERLVAALRAAGLPARLAYGLLYVGSVAVEHRWAEVHLGAWLPLDPDVGGLAGASHLRLAASPSGPLPTPAPRDGSTHPGADDALDRDPASPWTLLRRSALRAPGFRLRLLEAQLPSGFRFSPGGALNAQVTANVLTHRAWGFVLRRPLSPATRFVLPGAADTFEAQVAGTGADLRLTLRLYAASAEGLDARAFISQGYRLRQIGQNAYLVKDLSPALTALGRHPATPRAQGADPSPPTTQRTDASPPAAQRTGASPPQTPRLVRRSYLQIACARGPWSARLVRFTLDAHSVPDAHLAELETKTLGTFQMTAHPAGAASCTRSATPPSTAPDPSSAPTQGTAPAPGSAPAPARLPTPRGSPTLPRR